MQHETRLYYVNGTGYDNDRGGPSGYELVVTLDSAMLAQYLVSARRDGAPLTLTVETLRDRQIAAVKEVLAQPGYKLIAERIVDAVAGVK